MKRNWIVLLGCAVAMILLASPSEGRSRTIRHQCSVNREQIKELLKGWGEALNRSSPKDPTRVLQTYADGDRAVLLPTCANGPLTTTDAIRSYFVDDFLIYNPKVEIDTNKALIGVDCNYGFASGLYTFKLKSNAVLRARYTYVFYRGKIVQHHSSLEPQRNGTVPRSLCAEKQE